uniref:Uncharacterized protein n=1 Tax=Myoviridae sp. ctiv53 TaxID=2827703 RepID=A0A8S5TI17_9CAUD|nr:MAG TPA: hypothetical protein [Myoviridae sp. ctiv53]
MQPSFSLLPKSRNIINHSGEVIHQTPEIRNLNKQKQCFQFFR